MRGEASQHISSEPKWLGGRPLVWRVGCRGREETAGALRQMVKTTLSFSLPEKTVTNLEREKTGDIGVTSCEFMER